MLPVPMDWFIENFEPAKLYQHCLPQVFRYMDAVSNTTGEMIDVFSGSPPEVTDQWDTVHIQSMTGDYGAETKFFKDAGFGKVLASEEMSTLNGGKEWPSTYGFFDEGDYLTRHF